MGYKQRNISIKFAFQKDYSCFGMENETGSKLELK